MVKNDGYVKENRSDWVAVEAQFQNSASQANQPVRAKSAFQFFQKKVMPEVKSKLTLAAAEKNEPLDLGGIMKEVSARWHQLSAVEREEFVELAAEDRKRYEEECRVRDQEVEDERKRKREEMYGDVDGKRERKKVRTAFVCSSHSRLMARAFVTCLWLDVSNTLSCCLNGTSEPDPR